MPLTLTIKAPPWQAVTQSYLFGFFESKDEEHITCPKTTKVLRRAQSRLQASAVHQWHARMSLLQKACPGPQDHFASASGARLFFQPGCKSSIGGAECLSPFNHSSCRSFRVVDDTMLNHHLNVKRVTNRRESHKAGEESIMDLLRRHSENI